MRLYKLFDKVAADSRTIDRAWIFLRNCFKCTMCVQFHYAVLAIYSLHRSVAENQLLRQTILQFSANWLEISPTLFEGIISVFSTALIGCRSGAGI